MAKKKKLTKAERKEARLRKGKQWLLTYTGSPKKMNKHYRERFHVDAVTAAKDLQELGVNYTQEQLDQIKQAEEQRLQQRRMEWEAKEWERLSIPIEISILFGNSEHPFPERKNMPFRSRVQPFI